MTDAVTHKLVILWAHEIRHAAKALEAAFAYAKKPEAEKDPDEFSRLATNALRASYAALFHEEIAKGSPLVVCDDPAKIVAAEKENSPEYGEDLED